MREKTPLESVSWGYHLINPLHKNIKKQTQNQTQTKNNHMAPPPKFLQFIASSKSWPDGQKMSST